MKVKRGFAVVRIYRRPHPHTKSGYIYRVAWSMDGKENVLQRADFDAAHVEAVLKATQLASGQLAVAKAMSADDAGVLSEARRILEGQGTTITQALSEWVEAHKLTKGHVLAAARAFAAKGGAPKAKNVPEVVKAFLKHKKGRGVDTSASYDHYLPKLAEDFTGPIESITASMLENWVNRTFVAEGNKTVHPATFNTVRKRVVTLWRWARNERFLPQDTLTEAERIHATKENAPKREILSVADFARCLLMLRDTHPGYLAAAVLAGFCGLRRDEIHAQKWSDVNLKAAKLAVTAAKEGTPEDRLVEIPAAAVEWLLLCDRTKELVAPAWAQGRIRAFCREAKPAINCPPNGYRHSFVSYRVASSGSVAETALEAGNSAGVIFKHYRRPVSKEDGKSWFALTPAMAEKMGKVESIGVAHA